MPSLATDKQCAHLAGYSTTGVHTTWQAGGPYWLCPSYSAITDGLWTESTAVSQENLVMDMGI